MKINQPVLWSFLMGMVGTASAFEWSGPLSQPEFAAPKDCPPAVMAQVSAALNRRDAVFLGGRFFGSFSRSMRYGGDTKVLNGMLADLASCPGVILSVGFSTNFVEPADWMVSNSDGGTNFNFRVQVNLKSGRLKLDELVIPVVTGPPLAATPEPALPTANAAPSIAPVPSIAPGTKGREP